MATPLCSAAGISLLLLHLLVAAHILGGAAAGESFAPLRLLEHGMNGHYSFAPLRHLGNIGNNENVCEGVDEMWGQCPDLPSCQQCDPVDCQFSIWGDWYNPVGHCTGLQFRDRSIAAAKNKCGRPCVGPKSESRQHMLAACSRDVTDCLLSEWTDWSMCRIETGQVFRKRMILKTPRNGGQPCSGSTKETVSCGSGPQPVPCTFSTWQEWTACSSTCGIGRHSRMRQVLGPARHNGALCDGSLLETAACHQAPCMGGDCTMAAWSEWSMCSGQIHPQKFRRRYVAQSSSGSGRGCNETMKETQGCPVQAPVPCKLSEWTTWKAMGWVQPDPPACSKECDGGQAFRTRAIESPPRYGGGCDAASLIELRACNTQPCNTKCELSQWSSWSGCSNDCGRGTKTRQRSLSSAAHFSEGCQGALREALPCIGSQGLCPREDCAWSEWFDWTQCSSSCGGGLRRRSRDVLTTPKDGGKACEPALKSEAEPCSTQACGDGCVDAYWGNWQDWGGCSASCGSGLAARHRSIKTYNNDCGKPASGVETDYQSCSGLPPCTEDIDCQVADWSEWSMCSRSCFGLRQRSRYIKTFASGRGKACTSTSLKETAPCNPSEGQTGSAECGVQSPRDCELSQWGLWSSCSRSCGGGQRERKRKLVSLPRDGGEPCSAVMSVTEPCANVPCVVERCTDCMWGMWSDWGECTKCGGQRSRQRSIVQMPNHCGQLCDLRSAKELSNCTSRCEETLFCSWGDWSASSDCPPSCGQKTMMRSRALTMVSTAETFLFAAGPSANCQGAQLNVSDCPNIMPCNAPCVPRDCEFGVWGEWSRPMPTGLCERERKVVITNNECGKSCGGPLVETKHCVPGGTADMDCVLSAWTAWDNCEMHGSIGQRTRTRSVVQQAAVGGLPCNGALRETEQCTLQAPLDCTLALWSDWEACHKSCGGGWQGRKRWVLEHPAHGGAPCKDSIQELRSCGQLPCPGSGQDCMYGDWALWSGCDDSNQRYRERSIKRHSTTGGRVCDGGLQETQACRQLEQDCVVSDWTAWDTCDKTCGGGQHSRQRQIMKFPSEGGKDCPGDLIQTRGCNRNPCSDLDCEVGDWLPWTACTASCGPSQRHRDRFLLRLRTAEGNGCNLELSQTATCDNGIQCPRTDCQWADWLPWSGCSAPCSGGQRTRNRHVLKAPEGSGAACLIKDKEEVQACNTQPCSAPPCVDGMWSDWQPWSSCSASCGGGTTFRQRQIARMADACGVPATGDAQEVDFCNQGIPCEPDRDCKFTQWSAWSACSATCGGIMRRSRHISEFGAGHGKFCEGALKQTWPCNPSPNEEAPPACARGLSKDCELSSWSSWSTCSSSCGSGMHVRKRHVLRPAENGGKVCSGSLEMATQCANIPCPGQESVDCRYGEWSNWGECGKCGGERLRLRQIIQHPKHGGLACGPHAAREVGACPRQCHEERFCSWASWEAWGACTATCGKGRRPRSRRLHLSTVPAAPPPPVQDLLMEYSRLEHEAKGLQRQHRLQGLLGAFSSGLLVVCFGFVVVRALWARKNNSASRRSRMIRAGLRQRGNDGTDLRIISHTIDLDDLNFNELPRLPLIGDN